MKPGTILFATDLSSRCDRGLDRAVEIASRRGSRLVVVHALQDPEPAIGLPSWRRPPDPREAAMEQVRNDLRGAGETEIDVVVEPGDPAQVILGLLDRFECDLIVTGMARNETLGRFLLGSTVENLTRRTEVPVLVVKTRPQGPYRNAVVATDFSEGSRRALEVALAMLPEARISLFHAFDIPFEGIVDDRQAALGAAAGRAVSEGQAFLAATPAAAESGRTIPVHGETGEVGALLRHFSRAHKVDLLAVGTEGRGRLAHVLLGSTAQCILEAVPVDTLVVRRSKV